MADKNHFGPRRRKILLEHSVDRLLDKPLVIVSIDECAEPHSITPLRKGTPRPASFNPACAPDSTNTCQKSDDILQPWPVAYKTGGTNLAMPEAQGS